MEIHLCHAVKMVFTVLIILRITADIPRVIKNVMKNILFLKRTALAAVMVLVFFGAAGSAQAAVTILDNWAKKISNSYSSPQSFTYSVSAGTKRLLLVAITTGYDSNGTQTYSATYGGKALTMIAQYNTGRDNTWVGCLKEADISTRASNTIRVTYSGSPTNTKVFAASYQNVDQSNPVTDSNYNGSNSSVNSISFGRNITIANGDQLFYVAHSGSSYNSYGWSSGSSYSSSDWSSGSSYSSSGWRGSSSDSYSSWQRGSGDAFHTPPSGYTELLQDTGNGFTVSVGHRNSISAGSENKTVSFSSSDSASIVVASLNDASADLIPPTVSTFTIPSAATTLTVAISSFTATDNVAVTGYLVNESATPPTASDAGWSTTAPSSYTFTTAGSKILYAWAKDAAGNVSGVRSAAVTITLPDTTPPSVTSFTIPATSTTLSVSISSFTATDNVGVTGYLVSESASAPSVTASGWSAAAPAFYTFATAGSKTLYGWAKDAAGNVSAARSAAVTVKLGSPILIISSASNPFSAYYAEILRNEGINTFEVIDISSVSSAMLTFYDLVILGEMPLTTSQVTMLSNWVNSGGNLVAMRPDKKLADLLGLTDQSSTLSNAYLLVNTTGGPGFGIVNESIQFHGAADLYALNGAVSLATLNSNANTTTSNPAVTLKSAGTSGGQAAAFTYDLARSVVYTRQGNPAWAGQDRDGNSLIRSDDLFYGAASFDPQPDWIDLNKVAIPQADEQQRLLANLIIQMNFNKKPLPRFWYLPRNLAAAVIMTGDDHGNNGTAGRFDAYMSKSQPGCSVSNWECVRSTSYIYVGTPLTDTQAATYVADGFEVGLHVTTNCADWTPASLESFFADQLSAWSAIYSSLAPPVTNRVHCIPWSDYSTMPIVELKHGIRLDANYYYWPPSWVTNRPGFFTGSGMPMRFTDSTGTLIDVYQATTQMTDESGQTFPYTVDTLLDRAIGPEGYYGIFTVNAHTDSAASSESDAIVHSAQARGIPVISARQMLDWLDGRNASSFGSLTWNGNTLGFTITAVPGTNGLVAMLPVAHGQTVTGITHDGNVVSYTIATVKGVQYARFLAANGSYQVDYAPDVTPPTVSGVTPNVNATGVSTMADITATFNEAIDPAAINAGTFELRDSANILVPATVTYNAARQTATLHPTSQLAYSTTYTATIKGGTTGVKDLAGNPLISDLTWPFTTAVLPTGPSSIWSDATIPAVVDSGPDSPVELGTKFRSDLNGYITGIRFYKASTNTDTHVANLWTSTGSLLATATFSSETASGWQQVNFPNPVPIAANTVYVASYHTNVGHYSVDPNYFAGKGVDSPPLHALADGISGFNGVYAYGSTSSFPNQGLSSFNYWVDVVFKQILN